MIDSQVHSCNLHHLSFFIDVDMCLFPDWPPCPDDPEATLSKRREADKKAANLDVSASDQNDC